MSLTVTIRGTEASFFDSEKVIRLAQRGTIRSLSRCGAYVRTESKSSIRYAQKSATPGQPPRAKRGGMSRTTTKKDGSTKTRSVSPLKELIYFAYDPVGKSVVVGPQDFKNRATKTYRVPTVLESGGSVTARTPTGRVVSRRYAGNPFMAPALRRVQAKFPSFFNNLLG